MVVVKNENVVWIDVDDTLVMWPDDPYINRTHEGYVMLNHYGRSVWVKPHEKNIQLLTSYKERGYFVIVHSANGYRWAREVLTALLLSSSVNLVMTKAAKYVDDLDSSEWMMRVYINEVGINE